MGIKGENDDKYDMLIDKDLKFLFHSFNGYLSRINTSLQLVRYTTKADDDYVLKVLQHHQGCQLNKFWKFLRKIFRIRTFSSLS